MNTVPIEASKALLFMDIEEIYEKKGLAKTDFVSKMESLKDSSIEEIKSFILDLKTNKNGDNQKKKDSP